MGRGIPCSVEFFSSQMIANSFCKGEMCVLGHHLVVIRSLYQSNASQTFWHVAGEHCDNESSFFIVLATFTKSPILFLPKHLQTITEPPPCFTVEARHFMRSPHKRRTNWRRLLPNTSNFDSSIDNTFSQSSCVSNVDVS